MRGSLTSIYVLRSRGQISIRGVRQYKWHPATYETKTDGGSGMMSVNPRWDPETINLYGHPTNRWLNENLR